MSSAIIPNSYQTPNVLVDELMQWLTPNEWVVLSFMVRHIMGWQDKIEERRNRISLSQFEHGMNESMGGCGLSRPQITTALKALAKFRIISKVGQPNKDGQEWQIISHPEIDLDGLKMRKAAKKKRGQKRIKKAAAASAKNRKIDASGTPGVPLSGTPDVPEAQYATRTSRGTSSVPEGSTTIVHTKHNNKPNVVVGSDSDLDPDIQQQETPTREPDPVEVSMFDEHKIGKVIWSRWMIHEPVTVVSALLHSFTEDGIENPIGLARSMLERGSATPKRKYVAQAEKSIKWGELDYEQAEASARAKALEAANWDPRFIEV